MSILYITEPGSVLKKDGGRFLVKNKNDTIVELPSESLEAVVVFSGAHITSPCVMSLLKMGIPVTWLSSSGKYFGRLESTSHINVERQRVQFLRGEDETFRVELSREFIKGKVKNQIVLLRRYNRRKRINCVAETIAEIDLYLEKIQRAQNISKLLGLEGNATRLYFKALSHLVPDEFKFDRRNRQPPRDKFNSLLSFGYTLLMYDVYTIIVNKGLHPYAGFLHRIKRGHPALASDLMEEWRAVIVDSLVMSLVQKRSIRSKSFKDPDDKGGVYLDKNGAKLFISKYEHKIKQLNNYLDSVGYAVSFRRSIQYQAEALVKAIEKNDSRAYSPVIMR